jgi:hypothetical protein
MIVVTAHDDHVLYKVTALKASKQVGKKIRVTQPAGLMITITNA